MLGYQLSINAARRPDDIAVIFGPRRYTYGLLNDRACRLANGLLTLGVRPGERVAALLHNCNYFLECLFAAAKIGAVFVPINFRLVAREIGMQLEACTPKVLLAGEGFGESLAAVKGRATFPEHVLWLDDQPADTASARAHPYESWLVGQSAGEPAIVVQPGAVAMLLHSSGTTGLPKGAIYTHATALASCSAKIIDFALTPRDVTVVFGPLFHAGPLMDLVMPLLLRGGRVAIGASRGFDPQRLLGTIAAERGTVIPIYPTMLRRVLAEADVARFDLASLRLIVTGGEAAPIPVIRGVLERFAGAGFVNNYGSTEGGPITCFLEPAESARKMGSVGKESFSVEVRIADEEGHALGPGQVGEILVRSPFVCRGYWNRPDLTAQSQRDGWWRTGDLAWRDEEGFLWISGRSKDLIKSGTESIWPIEVEQVIAELPGVVEVGVIGVPDQEWGEAVAAFVVASADAALDAAAVIEHCRQHLASYKKPRHVRFVAALPRNTTNKVDKNALRSLFSSPPP